MTTQCDLNYFTSDIRVLELTGCIWKHHSTFQIGLNNSKLKTSFTVYSPFYAVAVMPLGTTRHLSGHECMGGGGGTSKFQPNRTWILPCRWFISAECCQFNSVGSLHECLDTGVSVGLEDWFCVDTWHSCDKWGGNVLRSIQKEQGLEGSRVRFVCQMPSGCILLVLSCHSL